MTIAVTVDLPLAEIIEHLDDTQRRALYEGLVKILDAVPARVVERPAPRAVAPKPAPIPRPTEVKCMRCPTMVELSPRGQLKRLCPPCKVQASRDKVSASYHRRRPPRPVEVKCADCPTMLPIPQTPRSQPKKRCEPCQKKHLAAYMRGYYERKLRPSRGVAPGEQRRPAPARAPKPSPPRAVPPRPVAAAPPPRPAKPRPPQRVPQPLATKLEDLPPSKFAAAYLPVPWAVDPRKVGPAPLTEDRRREVEHRVGSLDDDVGEHGPRRG